MVDVRVLLTTLPPDRAAGFVRTLCEERLVACGNIVPAVRSIYRWKDEMCDDTEALVVMETRADLVPTAMARARELHPYEVPKILELSPGAVLEAYARWVVGETGGDPDRR